MTACFPPHLTMPLDDSCVARACPFTSKQPPPLKASSRVCSTQAISRFDLEPTLKKALLNVGCTCCVLRLVQGSLYTTCMCSKVKVLSPDQTRMGVNASRTPIHSHALSSTGTAQGEGQGGFNPSVLRNVIHKVFFPEPELLIFVTNIPMPDDQTLTKTCHSHSALSVIQLGFKFAHVANIPFKMALDQVNPIVNKETRDVYVMVSRKPCERQTDWNWIWIWIEFWNILTPWLVL